MRKNKILMALLALVLMLVMLPAQVFAAGGGQTSQNGMVLNKTAEIQDDGTYTINLEAYATGETVTVTKTEPTDIVLVLDVSGSMDDSMQDAATYGYRQATGRISSMVGRNTKTTYHLHDDGTYHHVTWSDERSVGVGYIYARCDDCDTEYKQYYFFGITLIWETHIQYHNGWNLYFYEENYVPTKLEVLKNQANSFIDAVNAKNATIENENEQHRVAIVKFAGKKSSDVGNDFYDGNNAYNYSQIVANLTTVDDDSVGGLKQNINDLVASGATSADYGMEHAQTILNNSSSDRKKVVIFITDGEPNHSNGFDNVVANTAITTAKNLKDNGTIIYTLGVYDGANADDTSNNTNAYMNAMSNNYPNATSYKSLGTGSNKGYFKTFNNATELANIFSEIEQELSTSKVTLGTDSVMRDVLSDNFVLPADFSTTSNITIKTVKGTANDAGVISWGSAKDASDVTASVNGKNIDVTGFDYSSNYIVKGHPGNKLVVTITGILPSEDAENGDAIATNKNTSGIYAKTNGVLADEATASFAVPTAKFAEKAYVLDYAKKAELTGLGEVKSVLAEIAKCTTPTTTLAGTYGQATVENKGLYYTPTTTKWNGYDTMFALTSNEWAKVNVIPADSVYYEDEFGSKTGETGITYAGTWTTEGTAGNNVEVANSNLTGGWVATDNLADDLGNSNGSAHVGTASGSSTTATFDFSGTGFEIYSKTTSGTGSIYVQVKNASTNKTVKSYVINTSAVGTYYQVPVLQVTDLTNGDYKVTIIVTAADAEKLDFIIDGIRIFNPIAEKDATVNEAYTAEKLGGTYVTVKSLIADNNESVVFVDSVTKDGVTTTDVKTANIDDINTFGPYNEVYLDADQSLQFKPANGESYYVGIKAVAGTAGKVDITLGDTKASKEINSSADMYYEVKPDADGIVTIKNTGSTKIALTNIRTLGGEEVSTTAITEEEAYNAIAAFNALPYANMEAADSVEEAVGNVTIVNNKVEEMFNKIMISAEKIFAGFSGWFN